jgi:phospholipid transport system substrate-binding protein
MLYKFHESKRGWLIYDIEIQGVSIISTYRSQFDHVLSNGTIDDLLIKLEQPEPPEKPEK